MVIYKKGDIIKDIDNWDIIAHGCNCFCTMGAGIAKQIRTAFPDAYEADKATPKGDMYKLGKYTVGVIDGTSKYVLNLYTQFDYNSIKNGELQDKFEYDYFHQCMTGLNTYYDNLFNTTGKLYTLAMPKIGSGICGGDWNKIERIIMETNINKNLNIVIYEI